jgi:flagellar hook-basal body complex protein FliE
MSDIDISQVLQQMRSMAASAQNSPAVENIAGTNQAEFGQLLKDSINQVNATQKTSGEMSAAFEAGDASVNLSEVMIAIQKASVSFQAMTQVRNNLVSAYKEIMNMPV